MGTITIATYSLASFFLHFHWFIFFDRLLGLSHYFSWTLGLTLPGAVWWHPSLEKSALLDGTSRHSTVAAAGGCVTLWWIHTENAWKSNSCSTFFGIWQFDINNFGVIFVTHPSSIQFYFWMCFAPKYVNVNATLLNQS
jgi:hypothetical protein